MRSVACLPVLSLATLAVLGLGVAPARADAIGPPPRAEGCPRGSASEVANEMQHGQFAYCAPSIAGPTPSCWEGHARAVLELSIVERLVMPSSGHGAPLPTEPALRLAEVTGACDAPDDEPPLTASRRGLDVAFGLLGGPTTEVVPAGCHRIDVWVEDAQVHCDDVAPTAPTTSPAVSPEPPPTQAAPPTGEPIAVAAAEPERPTPASVTSSPPATLPGSGCACGVARRHEPRGAGLALVACSLAAVLRRSRRRLRR